MGDDDMRAFRVAVAATGLGIALSAGSASAQSPGYDGNYIGPRILVGEHVGNRSNPHPCEAQHMTAVHVQGGRFKWQMSSGLVDVTVGADGSFSANNGGWTLTGRITGGHFTADYEAGLCSFHYDLPKQSG